MRGWQESPDGLHDRIRYRREGGSWTIERLSP
jgi:pyridoxine/pyridoxamine 5'-phosphate oxidase